MNSKALGLTTLVLLSTSAAWPQNVVVEHPSVPIYRVTVVERSVKAVNYQYREGPTRVDFRGTVLLPQAKGDAVVESKAGRVEINAHFEHMAPPSRYGPEYLTYVLWAITPEGHAKSLGEVLANGSDRAHLVVTTDMQTFGLIVTAEPYSAVRQPSDVVVAENEIRPDTMGRVEPIQARFELLPRGEYTYNLPTDLRALRPTGPSLSMVEYESVLELYQAQNAVQIARAQQADRYAPDVMQKADFLLQQARDFQTNKAGRSNVVTVARQAAQTAEDARLIAAQRMQGDDLARARQEAADALARSARAEADAQRAREQASADRMQLDQERSARVRAENEAAVLRAQPAPPAPVTTTVVIPAPPAPVVESKSQIRYQLLQQINAAIPCMDTPRGLVVTLPDSDFGGTRLNEAYQGTIDRVAQILAMHPGLRIEVGGHADNLMGESRAGNFAYLRAASVRDALIRSGVPAGSIVARGYGSSRPVVSNANAAGRAQNRRVEITIAGDPIGTLASWDRTYSVMPRK